MTEQELCRMSPITSGDCPDRSCWLRLHHDNECNKSQHGDDPPAGTLPAPAQTPPPLAAPSPPAPPPSGTFAGVAQLNSSPGKPHADARFQSETFTVTGDQVRFHGFRGTIQPGGHLEMQAGGNFISGNFDGGRFVGSFWRPHPACTYDLLLNHVG